MKFISYRTAAGDGLGVDQGDGFVGLLAGDSAYPGDLKALLREGGNALTEAAEKIRLNGAPLDLGKVDVLPPLIPDKILCVGLNYADHAAESQVEVPSTPTLFSRFASSVIGPYDPISLPKVSSKLDFEGELAVIIGKRGRYITRDKALEHVAGYAVFNDASIRDYQLRTPQWMIGKNFDGSGPFGPFMVTADALPPGASGLKIETRLDGEVMQRSSTDQLVFDVAALITAISEAMTLEPGDVIITGTPAGVGGARSPQRFMQEGEVCEVEIEGIGILRNEVRADV